MLVHRRVTPSIKFAGTHVYTWVERGTVRVKCLAQEHNTARARTRTARSGVERTNHEATAPPTNSRGSTVVLSIFPVSLNFRLFMTTRNPKPELPPDGSAIISEVNFTTTRAGLTGQVPNQIFDCWVLPMGSKSFNCAQLQSFLKLFFCLFNIDQSKHEN